jgi:hypothetical protein
MILFLRRLDEARTVECSQGCIKEKLRRVQLFESCGSHAMPGFPRQAKHLWKEEFSILRLPVDAAL